MEEIWKDVVGYEGLYQVSNTGKVRTLNPRYYLAEKSARRNNYGYLTVLLSREGEQKRRTVHRLVAEAFISNPNNYPQINHVDEDKTNNFARNLEWCDAKYNVRCFANNHPGRRRAGKRSTRKVSQYSLDGALVKVWDNSRQIFLETGMSDWSISQCCRGARKTAYGYKWRYAS